jgi:DNA replication and repair protein RecF
MWIQRLYLRNFRSYRYTEVEFDKGLNVIHGENGQGKTNLVEALNFASTGRSFRTDKFQELISHDTTHLETKLCYEKDSISHAIAIQYGGDQKKIIHDATVYPTFSSLTGTLPTVVIAPSDIALIMGAPSDRRRFLNLLIAQHDPVYLYQLARYQKALKARNALLKRKSTQSIKVYEELLAKAATYLVKARIDTLAFLNPLLQTQFFELTQKLHPVKMIYETHSQILEEASERVFLNLYEQHREQETKLGCTLTGPHRDDIAFLHLGDSAKNFSSEGQKRALITALKLSELEFLKIKNEHSPLLIIDDFAIHLDALRSHLFEKVVNSYAQVFLTTPTHQLTSGSFYYVGDAKVQKLSSALK